MLLQKSVGSASQIYSLAETRCLLVIHLPIVYNRIIVVSVSKLQAVTGWSIVGLVVYNWTEFQAALNGHISFFCVDIICSGSACKIGSAWVLILHIGDIAGMLAMLIRINGYLMCSVVELGNMSVITFVLSKIFGEWYSIGYPNIVFLTKSFDLAVGLGESLLLSEGSIQLLREAFLCFLLYDIQQVIEHVSLLPV